MAFDLKNYRGARPSHARVKHGIHLPPGAEHDRAQRCQNGPSAETSKGMPSISFTMTRPHRIDDIGVRMALGVKRGNIFQLVVGLGLRLSTAGIVAGLILAFSSLE